MPMHVFWRGRAQSGVQDGESVTRAAGYVVTAAGGLRPDEIRGGHTPGNEPRIFRLGPGVALFL